MKRSPFPTSKESTLNLRTKLAILIGAIAGALLLIGPASAHTQPVVPGATCAHVGDLGTHDGQTYRCEKHLGEVCESWHWIYSGDVPKSGKTAWPHPLCPCESTTPTPTPAPSNTPTPTTSPSGSAAVATTPPAGTTPATLPTPVADTTTLPVTGSRVVGIVTFGLSLAVGGALLVAAGRTYRRRRTTT